MWPAFELFYVILELLDFEQREVLHLDVVPLQVVHLLRHEGQVFFETRHLGGQTDKGQSVTFP